MTAHPDVKEKIEKKAEISDTGKTHEDAKNDSIEEKIKEKMTNTENVSNEKFNEGILLYKEKKWEQALKFFLSMNVKDLNFNDKTEHSYYLGLCFTKTGNYEKAVIQLEQVVTANLDVLRVYQCRMALAYIYVITKRIKMAEFELNRLRQRGMESALLYNTLAYAALLQKKNLIAVELYEKSLEIDMNNLTAMNNIGFILADTGIDTIRGLRMCKRAVDAKPQNPVYLDSLGWAYYRSGEVLEARTWLRRALEIAPNQKEILRHFKIVTGEAK